MKIKAFLIGLICLLFFVASTSMGQDVPVLSHRRKAFIAGTVNIEATNDGRIRVYDEVYATARNDGPNPEVLTTQNTVGQSASGNFYLWRTFASFVLPEMTEVISASLFLDGVSNSSDADFNIFIHTSTYTDPLEVGDWGLFDGHQESGAYDGVGLNESWSSTDYSDNWNEIVFNSPGIDSVLAAQGSTFKIVIISTEDYNSSQPGEDEYVIFSTTIHEGLEPYLKVTYIK